MSVSDDLSQATVDNAVALRASGPQIAFPPGLKAGISCEDQGWT